MAHLRWTREQHCTAGAALFQQRERLSELMHRFYAAHPVKTHPANRALLRSIDLMNRTRAQLEEVLVQDHGPQPAPSCYYPGCGTTGGHQRTGVRWTLDQHREAGAEVTALQMELLEIADHFAEAHPGRVGWTAKAERSFATTVNKYNDVRTALERAMWQYLGDDGNLSAYYPEGSHYLHVRAR